MFFTRNRGWRKGSVMEIPELWYLEARWSKRWKLMKRQVGIYGRYGGIWHTWQIWQMWAKHQSYSQQRWTRDHLKLATQLSSLSAASLQRHLLLSCSWWVFNFDTIFGQQQKKFRSVAILCRAREVALARGESPTSLFFRSDISFGGWPSKIVTKSLKTMVASVGIPLSVLGKCM